MRAQISIETLIVFVFAFLIFTLLFFIISTHISSLESQKLHHSSLELLRNLANAVRETYMQGEGSVRTFYLLFPSSYNPNMSYISNNTIKIRILNNDYVESFSFNVSGSLPSQPGAHLIRVVSRGNSVFVNRALVHLSHPTISVIMRSGTTFQFPLRVRNLANSTVTVNATLFWPHSEVSVTPIRIIFPLPAGAEVNIIYNIFSLPSAVGRYVGNISLVANTSLTEFEYHRINFYVEVVRQ